MVKLGWFALAAVSALACGRSPAAPVSPLPAGTATEEPARGPGVGERAPALSITSIDGAPMALVRGKVTLIVFWATWSAPDKQELVKIEEIYRRYGSANLAILALSIDDEPASLTEFAKTYGLRFPIGWDAGHRIANSYRPRTEPTTYVVDGDGVIRFIHFGYHDGEAETIASEIASLLGRTSR
jgi:cytochrome c biogenesis protein CcmG/thiol:disulfide interchange protein DsbE